jgi:hypothetical protein
MKRFIVKSIVFVVLGIIILNVWGYVLINSNAFSKQLSWHGILRVIRKSQASIPSKVLLLGDSVGRQIFTRKKPNSLLINGSVLSIGHYILAYNAIKKNKNIKYIVLASTPVVIGHQFERQRTYHNFMKPFYTFENLDLISKSVKTKIKKKKLGFLVLFPFIKAAPCFSDINYSSTGTTRKPWTLSDIAIEYLQKLDSLCKQKNIKFMIVSPPIPKKFRKLSNNWEKMRRQIKINKLDHMFEGYFENLIYLNQIHLSDDGVHLKRTYLIKNRKKIIKKILPPEVYPLL